MGLDLNAKKIADAAQQAPAVGANGKPLKPAAMVWLNPGIDVTFDGEEEATFVGLNQGLPIDTMDPAKTNYSSANMRTLGVTKNALHAHLMAIADKLEPGQTVFVNLKCQLRKVNVEAPSDAAPTDAVAAALSNLLVA